MYAIVRTYRVKRDKLKELDRLVTEEFVPIVSALPGYMAYFGIDQGDGKWASVSIFNSENDAKRSTSAASDFVQKRVKSMIESGPEVTAGLVAAVGPSQRGAPTIEEPARTH